MTKEFYTELSELVKKYKLTLVTGQTNGLETFAKSFEGCMFFITDGTKNSHLLGGGNMLSEASRTIQIQKK